MSYFAREKSMYSTYDRKFYAMDRFNFKIRPISQNNDVVIENENDMKTNTDF